MHGRVLARVTWDRGRRGDAAIEDQREEEVMILLEEVLFFFMRSVVYDTVMATKPGRQTTLGHNVVNLNRDVGE